MGWIKKALIALLSVFLLGGLAVWYLINENFEDTTLTKSSFTVNAQELINAFQDNDSLANSTYQEQLITVHGRITETEAADSTVNAQELINAFQDNDSLANSTYQEQLITVHGRITETEAADSTVNIKFVDPITGSYLIFAFQTQHVSDAKILAAGDSVAIKASCSGNIFSQLRKAHMISFKRAVLVEKFKT